MRYDVSWLLIILCAQALIINVHSHGHITYPRNRHGGSIAKAADCSNNACFWFTNNVEISKNQETLLPDYARTIQRNITMNSESDYFSRMPWRAPGKAKVIGHGCGSGGGGPVGFNNGGIAPPGIDQGADGVHLPPTEPTVWHAGEDVQVAFAITTNHGGGYSWRLCKNQSSTQLDSDGISEECFQSGGLDFVGNSSWFLYTDGTKTEIPRTTVTLPDGSHWAMNPIPGCYACDTLSTCGPPMDPVPSPGASPSNPNVTDPTKCYKDCIAANRSALEKQGCKFPETAPPTIKCQEAKFAMCAWCNGGDDSAWVEQEFCIGYCDGAENGFESCPTGTSQFPEPVKGISGMGESTKNPPWNFSVMDFVRVPKDAAPGRYLLSWRWDCEQNSQIWQNCADIEIV